MKGNPQLIKVLNEVLRKELTGINQYFVQPRCAKIGGMQCSMRSTGKSPLTR